MQFLDPSIIPVVSTFFFVFAVVFGLLVSSKVGEFGKRINAIIALAVAAFSTTYQPLVSLLQDMIPFATIVLIILFFIVFLKKIAGGGRGTDFLPIVVVLGILLLILTVVSDRLTPFIPSGFDTTNVLWIVGILVVILFFFAVYKYTPSQAAPGPPPHG